MESDFILTRIPVLWMYMMLRTGNLTDVPSDNSELGPFLAGGWVVVVVVVVLVGGQTNTWLPLQVFLDKVVFPDQVVMVFKLSCHWVLKSV